jgi:two-component system, NarL family, response regulator LiaR
LTGKARDRHAPVIRVLIVDDHAVVREGLRSFLELQEGIEVAGDASGGEQALEMSRELAPDIVLMDLVMPGLDGIRAMRALHSEVPDARVIVLTSFLDDDRLLPAIQAGAAGYLLKNIAPPDLANAIRAAYRGEAIIDPTVAARLLQALAEGRQVEPIETDRLTPRELEVLELIVGGRSNKRIALELEISEKTVKAHVGHVLAKLGVADRTQAALLAVREGLVGSRSVSPGS